MENHFPHRERAKNEAGDDQESRHHVRGCEIHIRDGEDIFVKATFKIDPSKDPKWFDLTIIDDDGSKGISQLGIYKIEDDTVTFCIGGSDNRPADFTSKKNSGRVLTTYKRVKK